MKQSEFSARDITWSSKLDHLTFPFVYSSSRHPFRLHIESRTRNEHLAHQSDIGKKVTRFVFKQARMINKQNLQTIIWR